MMTIKRVAQVLTAMFLLAVNFIVGAVLATLIGVSAKTGGIVWVILSAVAAYLLPKHVLRVGVFTEAWTGFMNKAFKASDESRGWYNRIKDFSQYVENDVIHLVNAGVKPEVLVNNTSYPIGITTIEDADKPIKLNKFQTKRTAVKDDVLYAISYDKIKHDMEFHKDAIEDKKYSLALHSIAPQANKAGAPVLKTTGGASVLNPKLKALTSADLIALKAKFDALKVPAKERVLVLCPTHVNDLLSEDKRFANLYINHTTGKIGNLYSFEVYEGVDNPTYDATNGTKVPVGAVADAENHVEASVAFAASKVMKADGSLKMYYREAKSNPDTQQSEINFRKYSVALPMGEDCIGAIYSAKV